MASDAEELVKINELARNSRRKQSGKPKQGRGITVHEMMIGIRAGMALDADVQSILQDEDLTEKGKQRRIAEIRDAHAQWRANGFSPWMLPVDNPKNRRQ